MKLQMKIVWLALLLSPSLPAAVPDKTPPSKRDFARGFSVSGPSQPLLEVTLPDEVYATVLQDDLNDLRVFNREGGVVPHALCDAPAPAPAEPRLQKLAVFPLQAGQTAAIGDGTRIEVKTAGGTQVTVDEGDEPQASASGKNAYLIDLRELKSPVEALRFNWTSADAASEARLRIEASEDLQSWHEVMRSATLLHARAGGTELQRARIPLPEARYAFLRFEAAGDRPLPRIDGISVELQSTAATRTPNWVAATPMAADETATAFWFDAARRAPLYSADLRLPTDNMALVVALQSRRDADAAWQARWSGEIFALQLGSARHHHTQIHFPQTTDRFWRVEVLRGAETLGGMQPSLQLGYPPARLRFLAQGEGPFLVAYGSARVERQAPVACERLLGSLSKDERAGMTGEAQIESLDALDNPAALKALPKPTPLRQIILWAVLVSGALLVLAMAMTLLKKLKPTQ